MKGKAGIVGSKVGTTIACEATLVKSQMKPLAFILILNGLGIGALWVAHGADLATVKKLR